jgi:hypothetical protein
MGAARDRGHDGEVEVNKGEGGGREGGGRSVPGGDGSDRSGWQWRAETQPNGADRNRPNRRRPKWTKPTEQAKAEVDETDRNRPNRRRPKWTKPTERIEQAEAEVDDVGGGDLVIPHADARARAVANLADLGATCPN